VPIKEERERFLRWLAHIVQKPEILPHTSYLFITETTGTGRNLLASILVRALRGHVASGVALPALLDGSYNDRIGQKLLATVDELREGITGDGRYRRQQKLSSITTEEFRHINPKYGVMSVEKNCCRWLYFSNFLDALPFSNKDRRIIVVLNPIKGMPVSYYKKLYGLLGNGAFIGSVRKFLETLDISSFNPGEHAPMNAAKLQALEVMTTDTDRAVAAFLKECREHKEKDKPMPRELVSMREIRKFVENCDAFTNNNHLNHAVTEAGMKLTGTGVKVSGTRHAVVIVDSTKWDADDVASAKSEKLIETMGLKVHKDQDDLLLFKVHGLSKGQL
jgi:hypothetical protein